MSAQVQEVTASAQSLAEMAHELQAVVAQFKLETNAEEYSAAPFSSSNDAAFSQNAGQSGFERQASYPEYSGRKSSDGRKVVAVR